MKITVIGGGNMGITYAKSINDNFANAQISVAEKDEERASFLKQTTPFSIYNDAKDCLTHAEIVFLAIKPQVAPTVFKDIKIYVQPHQIIVSIMAGVTIQTIIQGLDTPKVVRAMPNLPAQVGQGVTGFIASAEVNSFEQACIQGLLSATGAAIQVKDEDAIDAITALSGSGPAYVFYFMNAMIEQAKQFGFSEAEAKNITLNTFKGTAKLFRDSDTTAASWIAKVTSKGGTTHAALGVFKEGKLDEHIKKGVQAAYLRAQELGKKE